MADLQKAVAELYEAHAERERFRREIAKPPVRTVDAEEQRRLYEAAMRGEDQRIFDAPLTD